MARMTVEGPVSSLQIIRERFRAIGVTFTDIEGESSKIESPPVTMPGEEEEPVDAKATSKDKKKKS